MTIDMLKTYIHNQFNKFLWRCLHAWSIKGTVPWTCTFCTGACVYLLEPCVFVLTNIFASHTHYCSLNLWFSDHDLALVKMKPDFN